MTMCMLSQQKCRCNTDLSTRPRLGLEASEEKQDSQLRMKQRAREHVSSERSSSSNVLYVQCFKYGFFLLVFQSM